MPEARWNYQPCQARRVRVICGEAEGPLWWCVGLEGTEREAVEIVQGDNPPFYIDNCEFSGIDRQLFPIPPHAAGEGWAKVIGGGGPDMGHCSLSVAAVLGEIEG
jgi:hypothetical protein